MKHIALRLGKYLTVMLSCVRNCLWYSRGDEFRTVFACIGEVRCLIPSNVNVIALTATATFDTLSVVTQRLSLYKPAIVAVSPNRANIKLTVQPSKSMKEFAQLITSKLKVQQRAYPKTIVFARSYQDCSSLYLTISHALGKHITYPAGYPNLLKYHLLSMYTQASTDEMKTSILSTFSLKNSTLRLIVATTSFSMGIDIPDVREVIYWGPPSELEQYAQEIGRAGRDGKDSVAILMFDKPNRYTKQGMKLYTQCKAKCRRNNLFSNFIQCEHHDNPHCKCCDICELVCNCTICKMS